jgi:hypothetical protein
MHVDLCVAAFSALPTLQGLRCLPQSNTTNQDSNQGAMRQTKHIPMMRFISSCRIWAVFSPSTISSGRSPSAFTAVTSAPLDSKKFTTRQCPHAAAACNGVHQSLSFKAQDNDKRLLAQALIAERRGLAYTCIHVCSVDKQQARDFQRIFDTALQNRQR